MQDIVTRLVAYFALILLLGVSVTLSSLDPGALRTGFHFAIALVQAGLIFTVFMQLRVAPPLIRVMAGGSALWLMILFVFTLLDYLHR